MERTGRDGQSKELRCGRHPNIDIATSEIHQSISESNDPRKPIAHELSSSFATLIADITQSRVDKEFRAEYFKEHSRTGGSPPIRERHDRLHPLNNGIGRNKRKELHKLLDILQFMTQKTAFGIRKEPKRKEESTIDSLMKALLSTSFPKCVFRANLGNPRPYRRISFTGAIPSLSISCPRRRNTLDGTCIDT
jgi:hypothetical protein